jgi:signal transduction histidine kinase
MVTATLTELRPEAKRLGIQIDEVTAPAAVEGDPILVQRLITNLVTNAVRHNVVDGHIEVVTAVKDGRASMSVSNTGPVIPPVEVERLFRPFERLDRRRAHHNDGHGLGLSIVHAIAGAHDAELDAQARSSGGLRIEISFPPVGSPQPPVVTPALALAGSTSSSASADQANC